MKNSISLLAVLFSMFTICKAQNIELHSITTNRQSAGDLDLTGKMLQAFETNSEATSSVKFKDASSGIYPVKIFNKNGSIASKVFKR